MNKKIRYMYMPKEKRKEVREKFKNTKAGRSANILLKRLLVELRVDSSNLKRLLEDRYGDQSLIDLLFELKMSVFRNVANENKDEN